MKGSVVLMSRDLLERVLEQMKEDFVHIANEWGLTTASPEDDPVIHELAERLRRAP